MGKRFFIIMSFCVALCSAAMAQTRVRGTVVSDGDGLPVIGATVAVEGSNVGAVTNSEGRFDITMPRGAKNVRVSFVGYKTAVVPVRDGMKVTLYEDQSELDEVIVTGYGNFKKASFTGSAQTLETEALEDVPVLSIADKLAGGVAGVTIGTSSSSPGGVSSIRIRGMSSINAGNDPLIVIDGTPVQSGNISYFSDAYNDTYTDVLSSLNTNDIESMTVIKDAAAASLYGSRAANGVIVITTKSGKAGKTNVSFRSDWGFSNMAINYRPTLSGDDRRELLYTGLKNYAIYQGGYSEADAEAFADSNIDTFAAKPSTGWTDWLDLLTRTGSHQNYQLSVSGGNDRTKFYASLAYNKQEGILYDQGLERFTGNANLTHKFGRFELQVTSQLSRVRQNKVNEYLSYDGALFNYLAAQSPSDVAYDEDGNLVQYSGAYSTNPLYEDDHSSNTYTMIKAFNTVKLTYNIWDNLKLSEKISYDYVHGVEDVLWDKESQNGGSYGGVMQRAINSYGQLNTQTQLSYAKSFGQHNVDALLGFETEDYDYQYNYMFGQDYPGNLYELANAGTTSAETATSSYRMTSFLGRVDYNYANRYYLGASYRMDGTSRLSRENRWGSFWSVSGAWRFTDEKFLEPVKSVLTDGKLRLSYGVNGTQPSSYYGYMNLYSYGIKYDGTSGMGITSLANPDLKWEKNATWNIGLDLTFINRITLSFDYYQRKTSDLIYDMPVSQTGGYYNSDYTYTMPTNIGEMQNKGFELTVTSVNFDTKDFSWTTSLNMAHNSNELTKLDGETNEITSGPLIHRVGEPYYSYYLYEYAGVDPETGNALYYINDGTENARNTTTEISEANRTIVGSHQADIEGGLTNQLRWKFIDLGFTFTYSLGGEAFDYTHALYGGDGDYYYGGVPSYYDLDEMWSGPGDTSCTLPKFEYGNTVTYLSSRWLMPTDYLRLKNLTLGFSLPKNWISKIGLSKARIYFSGSNLLTWKSDDLLVDPEMPVSGVCLVETPAYRTYTFGLEIDF